MLYTLMLFFIIVPSVGLAIDAGIMYYIKGKLQTAVDGAALGAARSLSSSYSRNTSGSASIRSRSTSRKSSAEPITVTWMPNGSGYRSVEKLANVGVQFSGCATSNLCCSAATSGSESRVAALACDSLGRIGANAAVGPLSIALGSSDAGVRSRAAVGMGEAGLASANPALSRAARSTASRALGHAFARESDPEVRWRLAWASAGRYYGSAAPVRRRMLGDREELVRRFGVSGLGKLKDRANVTAVRLLAHDPSWRVRVEVRNALKALNDRTVVNVVPPPVPAADHFTPQPVAKGTPIGPHPQIAFVTTKGTFVVELFPDAAAYQVDNFVSLVDRGFYNNTRFFRVIADFVVQGGDPTNTGDGDAGYTVPAELNPLEQLSVAKKVVILVHNQFFQSPARKKLSSSLFNMQLHT